MNLVCEQFTVPRLQRVHWPTSCRSRGIPPSSSWVGPYRFSPALILCLEAEQLFHALALAEEETRPAPAPPRSIDLDEHVVPFDLDGKTPHACRGRRASNGASLDVEVGTVPGTLHGLPAQFAFAQRPAPVRAGVVDRVEGPLHVEQADTVTIGLNHLARSGCQVTCLCDLHCLRHDQSSLG